MAYPAEKKSEEPHNEVSARLLARKAELIQSWENRLRRSLPKASRVARPMLLDGLPEWIDRLAEALSPPYHEFKLRSLYATAKVHGQQRAYLDFDLTEVLLEYVILRRVIFEKLEEQGPLEPRYRDIVIDAIQESTRDAVTEFSRLHWKRQKSSILDGRSRSVLSRAVWTTSIIIAAAAIQWIFWPVLNPHSYILFFPAVILASVYGIAPLAIALSVLLTEFFFLPPFFQLKVPGVNDLVRLAIFAGCAAVTSRVTAALQNSRKIMQADLEQQAVARLEAERNLASLDYLVASAPVGIAFLDPELRYFKVNEPLAEWNGLPPEKHIGRNVREILGERSVSVEPVLRQILKTGEPCWNMEHEEFPKNDPGRRHFYTTSIYPVRTAGGERLGLGAIVQDVTEQKMLETLREQFVSALSHDLRTPLTAARMSAQLCIRNSSDPKRVAANSSKIVESIDRADRMIVDLLDVSQIRTGRQLPVEAVRAELASLIRETIDELRSIHGDRFTLELAEPVHGEWDIKGIRRVIENLVNNAVKYGSEFDPISISLQANDETVEISVQNRGEEIPPRERERLFDYFQRGPGSKKSGWGIGLMLVRGVAEAHGGSVALKSDSSTGTTFIVSLPRWRSPQAVSS